MVKAIYEGSIPFYISENHVVLCAGNETGSLPTKYFRSVTDLDKKSLIYSAPFDYICVYDFEA